MTVPMNIIPVAPIPIYQLACMQIKIVEMNIPAADAV